MLSVKGVKDMGSKEWLVQLPFIALVSICSGLLGALFNALHKLLRKVNERQPALMSHLTVQHHLCSPARHSLGRHWPPCCCSVTG